MRFDGPRVLMLAGVLLLFGGLVLFRPIRFNSGWSIDIKDWLHWAGIAAGGILLATSLLALSRFRRLYFGWMDVHCLSSVVSTGLVLVHSRTKAGVILPIHYHSYLTLGLVIILALSGVFIRLYPGNPHVNMYLRVFHLPVSIGFYITLFYHVVVKLGVI
ncbi:hypothetical protein GF326_12420 [Candidatus Bathyarchaeota archaeon]|nr:hypothetical protein [Candidatus Bathyarchaeota archaeon]